METNKDFQNKGTHVVGLQDFLLLTPGGSLGSSQG